MERVEEPTAASRYLVALAGRLAKVYVAETAPRAILLTGSAAEGVSDSYSDLDLIIYHDRLPTDDQLAAARASIATLDSSVSVHRDSDGIIEFYDVAGVECQVAHLTVTAWERDMASVLEAFDPTTVTQKAIMGLLDGVALHGDDLMARWQTRAMTYPDGLARAMVEHHLRIFPLWLAADRWPARDASIFYYQMLVEASLNLLAVLAGLNGLYFSAFQFKRLHKFAGRMRHAPNHLADRLDELFVLDPVAAGNALEGLVSETVTLVETHLPTVDTAPVRRRLGVRRPPWRPTAVNPGQDQREPLARDKPLRPSP
jgi:hypothetical protein